MIWPLSSFFFSWFSKFRFFTFAVSLILLRRCFLKFFNYFAFVTFYEMSVYKRGLGQAVHVSKVGVEDESENGLTKM